MTGLVTTFRLALAGLRRRGDEDDLLIAGRIFLVLSYAFIIVGIVLSIIAVVSTSIAASAAGREAWEPVLGTILTIVSLAIAGGIVGEALKMIEAVGQGRAFAGETVRGIEHIAMRVLAIQCIGTLAHVLRIGLAEPMGIDVTARLSTPGIGLVLVLFILARVFREGARMRADLEGTV